MQSPPAGPLMAKEGWEKDADVKHCRRCSKVFSVFTRKSHCRLCGRIFCGDCVHSLDVDITSGVDNKKQRETVKGCQNCIVRYRMNKAIQQHRNGGATTTAVAADGAPDRIDVNPQGTTTEGESEEAIENDTLPTAAATTTTPHEDHTQKPAHMDPAPTDSAAAHDEDIHLTDDEDDKPQHATDEVPGSGTKTTSDANVTDEEKVPHRHAANTTTINVSDNEASKPSDAAAQPTTTSAPAREVAASPVATTTGTAPVASPTAPIGAADSIDEEGDDWETYGDDTAGDAVEEEPPALGAAPNAHSSVYEAVEVRGEASVVFDFCADCGCIKKRCECAPAAAAPSTPANDDQQRQKGTSSASSPATTAEPQPTARATQATKNGDASNSSSSVPSHPKVVDAQESSAPPAKCPAGAQTTTDDGDATSQSLASTAPVINDKDHQESTPAPEPATSASPQPCTEPTASAPSSPTTSTEPQKEQPATTPTSPANGSTTKAPANSSTTSTSVDGGGANKDNKGQQLQRDHSNSSIGGNTNNNNNSLTPSTSGTSTRSSVAAGGGGAFAELDYESARIAAKCSRFLRAGERIVKIQTVKKSRYLISHERVLVLTDQPRLFYVDEGNVLKGSLVLDPRTTRIVSTGPKQFVLRIEGGKEYNFTTAEVEDADKWVHTLQTSLLP